MGPTGLGHAVAEVWVLTARLLRTSLRSRTAAVTAVLFLVGIAAAAWIGWREPSAAGVPLLGAMSLLTFVVVAVAVGAGAVLPDDRSAGREEWLATLAPPAWKRRLAAVLSGWVLAAGLGLAGGLLVGALAHVLRPGLSLRPHRAMVLPEPHISGGPEDPVVIVLGPEDPAWALVEVDVRPRFNFYQHGQVVDRLRLQWRAGSAGGEREISARGAVQFRPPADAAQLTLTSLTPNVHLRVTAVRRLGAPDAPIAALAWTGLLLGLLVGAAAPIAVLISRSTTGQTAAAGAVCLLLLGAARGSLVEIAGSFQADGWRAAAAALLRATMWAAPEVHVFGLLDQVLTGLVPSGWPLAALGYTGAATVLACLPMPRAFCREARA